jgi:small-conductance mechanosensitive channel/CRP-like cAMP-binding protein
MVTNWDYATVCSLILIPLIPLLLFFRRLTANTFLKKKLRLSVFLMLGVLLVWVLVSFFPYELPGAREKIEGFKDKLGMLLLVVAAWAAVSAVVSLLFNPFRQVSVPDKYPAIVQDAVVVGIFVLLATVFFPDQLFATSAITALILGLALQDTLGNLFAGLAIQIEKPFRVGDWVTAADHMGKVVEVTWRATKIRTRSGMFVIIPNNVVSKQNVINYSHPSPIQRVEYVVGLGYEVHPNQVKQVAREAMADIDEILRDPAPDVLVSQYADSAIQYRCRFWVSDFGRADVLLDRFSTLLYYHLKRSGLSVPFPIRDVRMMERQPLPEIVLPQVDDRADFVEKTDLFLNLEPADRQMIADAMETVTFAANESIIRQGQAGDSMFFIRRGKVRILLSGQGTEHEVAVLEAGEYFGEMALLTGETRTATVRAVEDAELYVLRKEQFRNVLLTNRAIAESISRLIANRKRLLEVKTAEVSLHDSQVEKEQENILSRIQKFFGL